MLRHVVAASCIVTLCTSVNINVSSWILRAGPADEFVCGARWLGVRVLTLCWPGRRHGVWRGCVRARRCGFLTLVEPRAALGHFAVAAPSVVARRRVTPTRVRRLTRRAPLPPSQPQLGNVLEAPTEGEWAPAAEEFYFNDYVSRGFQLVRVPVRWDKHTDTASPFTVDATFLARVQTIVGWGLSRNVTVIVNTHHDDWIDDTNAYASLKPRFVAIWAQVAAAFADAPSNLRFEVINEPIKLTITQLNDLYAAVVPVIRAAHPVRPIYLGGLSWMSPYWVINNPDAIAWPALASGEEDPNLRLEVHSYDP